MITQRLQQEKRVLQALVGLAAATPVLVGIEGAVGGPSFLDVAAPWPIDLDSHFRFYSAIFLAIGIGWYSTIPGIETRSSAFRMLAMLTFAGGLGRFLSLLTAGYPSSGHLLGLGMELVGVPLLVLWQARIARKFAASLA